VDSASADEKAALRWPSFRGLGARGWVDGKATPTKWDVVKKTNVRWKTRIPGLGLSSPIVWGDRVYVTTAVSEKDDARLKVGLYGEIKPADDNSVHKFQLLALDRRTGEVLWTRSAHEGVPKIQRHTKSSHANSTPATDGKNIVAFFGSEGLFCYDVDGELMWKKDLGRLDSGYYRVKKAQWGFGSSPVIHDGRVIVQCDVQEGSFLAAYKLEDGSEVWKTPREDVPTWSTPAVHVSGGVGRVFVNGYRRIGGYDLASGKEIWRLEGGGDIPVPTPIVWEDLVFVTNAHGRYAPIYALRTNASGTIELGDREWKHEHLAWSEQRGGNYMQTPIVYRGLLYACRDNGVLSCFDARTGERHYRQRLGKGRYGFTASPVAADGKLYFTSEDGEVHVIAAGREMKTLAVNMLASVAMATPAIADGEILFRTRRQIVCVSETAAKD
jgi:outer membrane protein assembly factor BamB